MDEYSLPRGFLREMRARLGKDFPAYCAAMRELPYRGIRRATLRCSEQELAAALPFPIKRVPFSPDAFTAPPGARLGALPAHHAGMFYATEPSATAAVPILDPRPGELVLDLCAAPGGKACAIAERIGEGGLLVANEVAPARLPALRENLARLGAANTVVTNCRPEELAAALPGAFDRVLVDAPCSGEGLFRRDPAAVREWAEGVPEACARRQKQILREAAALVRQGGTLVYATCSFSRVEDEGVVEDFLREHPDFSLEPTGATFERPLLGGGALLITPLEGGEGQFVARLRRAGDRPALLPEVSPMPPPLHLRERTCALLADLLTRDFNPAALPLAWFPAKSPSRAGPRGAGERGGTTRPSGDNEDVFPRKKENLRSAGAIIGRIALLPEGVRLPRGAAPIAAGVTVALAREDGRLEPCHDLFHALRREDLRRTIALAPGDPALAAFLRGEEISCGPALRGAAAVCLGDLPVGYGNASGGRLKNKYPKTLRNR